MASTTPLISPGLDNFHFQRWSFQKAMVDAHKEIAAEQQLHSEPPSPDMFNTNSATEDQIHIQTPELKSIQSPQLRSGTAARKERRSRLLDRYMSSEEQLSPLESVDSASSTGDLEDYIADDEDDMLDDDEESFKMDWLEGIFGEFTCKMATAICFIPAGKPRVVEIPVPSLTSSPSLSSDSDKMESSPSMRSSMEENLQSYIPPRPKTPVRRRPVGHGFGITLGSSDLSMRARMPTTTSAAMSTPAFSTIETYQPTSPERKPIQKSAPRQVVDKPTSIETYMPTAPNFLTIDPFAKSAVPQPPTPLTASFPKINNSTTALSTSAQSNGGHSRIRNLSQKLHFFGKNSSKVDLLEDRPKTRDSVDLFGHHKPQLSISDPYNKPRSMSIPVVPASRPATSGGPKPRMIPRGAAERAPAIEIPPCPEGLDLKFDGPVSASQGHPKILRRRKSSALKF